MGEWKKVRLGEICEKIAMGPFGSNIKVETFVSEGVPIISGQHLKGIYLLDQDYNYITKEHAQKLKNSTVYPGDVIFTHAGNIGQVAMIPYNAKHSYYMISQRQFFMRCNKLKILPEFLTYWFHTPYGQGLLLANSNPTGVPSISQPSSYLKSIEIFLPPLSIQKRIAAILSSLDDKIELNNRMNRNLEQQAQAVFREWFIDNHIPNKILDELIYFDPTEKIQRTKDYLFFDMKCLSANNMNLAEGVYRCVNSGSSFRNNDVLLAKITPCLENGKTGFVNCLENNQIARGSTEFIVMRNKKEVSPYWVYCLARNDDFRDVAIKSMVGSSGRQRVQTDVLRNYEIYYNKELMMKFDIFAGSMFKQIAKNKQESQRLSRIRDALLPKLMSGEIKL